jgi:hypothetical protein
VVLDAVARHDLSLITGSPAKMWVAALSLAFDAVFIHQAMAYGRPATAQHKRRTPPPANPAATRGIAARAPPQACRAEAARAAAPAFAFVAVPGRRPGTRAVEARR